VTEHNFDTVIGGEVGDSAPWALTNLPPFPAVALRLLSLLSQEDTNLDDVARLIAAEPVFAADLLRVANSAMYGTRSQVRTITQAVLILGLERVRGIGLTRAMGIYVLPAMGAEPLRRCWTHSLAGALLAGKIASACRVNQDVAYTAGLLRDIGRLALLVKYPGPYANLLTVTQENGFDPLTTERDLFDIDHCQAAEWLMRKMSFPEELRVAAINHHGSQDGPFFGLVQAVQRADAMSEALGFGAVEKPEPELYPAVVEELPEAARSSFPDDPDNLRCEVLSTIQFYTA
jgi:putative nucleotidyltransferase with HDIG domain